MHDYELLHQYIWKQTLACECLHFLYIKFLLIRHALSISKTQKFMKAYQYILISFKNVGIRWAKMKLY